MILKTITHQWAESLHCQRRDTIMARIKSILDFVNTFSRRRIEIRRAPLNLVLLRNTRLYHPPAAVSLRVAPVINIFFTPLLKTLRFESTLFKYFILNKPSFSAPDAVPAPVPGTVLNRIFNASSFRENAFGLIVTKDKGRQLNTKKTHLNIMGKPVFVYRRALSSEAGDTVPVSQTLSNRILAANHFIKNVFPTQRNHGAEPTGIRNVQQVVPGETGDTVTVSQTLSNRIFTANRILNRTQRFYPVSGDSRLHFSFVEQPKSFPIKGEKGIIPGAAKRQPGGRPRIAKTIEIPDKGEYKQAVSEPQKMAECRDRANTSRLSQNPKKWPNVEIGRIQNPDRAPTKGFRADVGVRPDFVFTRSSPGVLRQPACVHPAFSHNLLESRNIFDNIFNTFIGVNRHLAQFNRTQHFYPVSGDSRLHFSFVEQPKSFPIKREKDIIPGAAKRQPGGGANTRFAPTKGFRAAVGVNLVFTRSSPGVLRQHACVHPAFSHNLLESRNIFDNIFNTFTGMNRHLGACPRINEGGSFREKPLAGATYYPPNPPAKAFDKVLGKPLIKSFLGVQGAIFQKSPLAAGGKKIELSNRLLAQFNRTQRFYPVSGDSYLHFSFVEQPKSFHIKKEKNIIPGAAKRQPGGRPRIAKTIEIPHKGGYKQVVLKPKKMAESRDRANTSRLSQIPKKWPNVEIGRIQNPDRAPTKDFRADVGVRPDFVFTRSSPGVLRQPACVHPVFSHNLLESRNIFDNIFNTFTGVNRYLAQFNRVQRFYPVSGDSHVHIHSFKQSISPPIKGEREHPFQASPGMDLKTNRYPYPRQHVHTHHDGYPSHSSLTPAALELVTKKINRNEKQIDLEKVQKTIYREVSKQVEQTINKTIDRRMAFDSRDTHRLTENIYSRLVNRIALEKERVGY